MPSIRLGIIGARRRAQGIGEYLARDLAAAGADVRAVVGTRPETVQQARENLQARHGLSVRGYCDVAEMIDAEDLQAIAICSPYQYHREHVATALRFEQHVLCEKPLVFESSRDNTEDARQLTDGVKRAGRLLMVNEQWPYTLPTFDRCFPGIRTTTVTQLAMLLAPSENGLAMIPNAMPHVISILLALCPSGGNFHDIEFLSWAPGDLRISANYVHSDGRVEIRVCLRQVAQQPRPAGYAINGCGVWRRIAMPSYQMYFTPVTGDLFDLAAQAAQDDGADATSANHVPLEDPLRMLANDFISRISFVDSQQAVDPILLESVRLLEQIYRAGESVLMS